LASSEHPVIPESFTVVHSDRVVTMLSLNLSPIPWSRANGVNGKAIWTSGPGSREKPGNRGQTGNQGQERVKKLMFSENGENRGKSWGRSWEVGKLGSWGRSWGQTECPPFLLENLQNARHPVCPWSPSLVSWSSQSRNQNNTEAPLYFPETYSSDILPTISMSRNLNFLNTGRTAAYSL
jgi:hypothetical protein